MATPNKKAAVLGTGDVGKTLANALIALGYEVMMGSREANNAKAVDWAKTHSGKAHVGTFEQAAKFSDNLVLLATLGAANESAIKMAGPENLKGKVIIDTTNPLDFSKGMPPTLFLAGNDSGGEQVQRLTPGAHVVKAFNSVGHAHMFKPEFPGGPPDMFICGDDAEAKAKIVTPLLKEFGWGVIDIGGIKESRYLEPLCLIWVLHGMHSKGWNHAFKMLHK